MTPQDEMTKGEQLTLMRSLLSKSWDPIEGSKEPLQVDILYCQILTKAFGNLEDEVYLPRLKILYTLLCTEECLHISCS
jgi:hypothetical protein